MSITSPIKTVAGSLTTWKICWWYAVPAMKEYMDILTGCRNNKKIEEYGLRKYFDAEERIRMWRGTTWLKLIVFALNKGDQQ